MTNDSHIEASMKLQRAEFDAVKNLADRYHAVTLTPIVDEDYPEVRHYYEGAVLRVLDAFRENGRRWTSNDPMIWAQGLIQQLPDTHEGRNSWLLNYGVGEEAENLRQKWAEQNNKPFPRMRELPQDIPKINNCA